MPLERPASAPPALSRLIDDLGGHYAGNALVAFIFAASGPVAIILAVGTRGGLSEADLASWIFGAFFLNGLLSIFFCWFYRQPLVFFWTIPGAVLVGPALGHLTFPQVIGAYLGCGVLMLVLGLSGLVKRAMEAIPMPIVMGMVAGVFLRFGLDLVYAIRDAFWIAAPMAVAFLALSLAPRLAKALPPVIGAMIVGGVMVVALGRFNTAEVGGLGIVHPNFYVPQFSWRAMLELVVPLAVTVLVVQNGQGVAVLRATGHQPPINSITAACGLWSIPAALVGAVSTCLTGPVNAIITASGERQRQYTSGILVGVLALGFGLFSPVFTHLLLATPRAFIGALAGLAMLRVLQTSFVISFGGRFTLGALVTFLVTVADVPIFNVGAAFWGLVFGFAVSWLLERKDFAK